MIRLFLVDDHTVLRNGLRALLTEESSFQIVGEAADGQQLLDQLATISADVVLLDLHMPVLDGLATTRRLQAEFPQVRVLILSMVEHPHSIGQVLAAGAQGYVLKNASKEEILIAIQSVSAGKRFLCSEIGLALLDTVLRTDAPPAAAGTAATQLTRREHEIVRLVAEGLTTQQIAEQLFTSKRTVETHRQKLLEKTGTNNSASLIKYAVGQGWLA